MEIPFKMVQIPRGVTFISEGCNGVTFISPGSSTQPRSNSTRRNSRNIAISTFGETWESFPLELCLLVGLKDFYVEVKYMDI